MSGSVCSAAGGMYHAAFMANMLNFAPPPPHVLYDPARDYVAGQDYRRWQNDVLNYEPPKYGTTFDDRFAKTSDSTWMPGLGTNTQRFDPILPFKDAGILDPTPTYVVPKIEPAFKPIDVAPVVHQTLVETVWKGSDTSHISYVKDEGYHITTDIAGFGKREGLLGGLKTHDYLSDFS